MGHQSQQRSKRPQQHAAGDWHDRVVRTHLGLQFSSRVSASKSRLAPAGTTRIPRPIPWKHEYIALRGLISETNVFNLIDQKQ
jgi:hypothetical protein